MIYLNWIVFVNNLASFCIPIVHACYCKYQHLNYKKYFGNVNIFFKYRLVQICCDKATHNCYHCIAINETNNGCRTENNKILQGTNIHQTISLYHYLQFRVWTHPFVEKKKLNDPIQLNLAFNWWFTFCFNSYWLCLPSISIFELWHMSLQLVPRSWKNGSIIISRISIWCSYFS